MATETKQDSSTPETGDQEQQGQEQQATTPETGDNGEQQPEASKTEEPVKLPEDHPLVKKLATQKTDIAKLKTDLAEARAQAGRTTQLEEDLGKRPTQEALDTLQTRYDRLEAFIAAAPGPLARALDSRTFTRDLFETDKDIKDLVQEFARANPTATSEALGSAPAEPGKGKVDPNTLIRIAAGKQ